MKTLLLNKKVLRIYDCIDEMPIVNFQKYNKYLLIDAGIGSDVDDVDAHIMNIARYIKGGNQENALQELQNMRQNIYMVNSEISPKYMAFAALVKDVDGVEVKDLSDDGLKSILADINQVRHSSIVDYLFGVKKKIANELDMYFPGEFVDGREKEAYDRLKKRTLIILDGIINNVDTEEAVEEFDTEMVNKRKPNCYYGSGSVEIKSDKQFESTCILIAQKTSLDAKAMTVLQFYNAIIDIKKQMDAELKSYKKGKQHG